MRKIYAFAILVLIFSLTARGQYVNIPDVEFRDWLINNGFSSCISGNQLDTTCPVLLAADTLNITSSTISNLDGVQYFDNVHSLKIYINSLATVPTFPPLVTNLWLASFNFANVPAWPAGLQRLYIGGNNLLIPTYPATLKSLVVENAQHYGTLPPNLECLKISGAANVVDTLYFFPPSLDTIVIQNSGFNFLPQLPQNLKVLYLFNLNVLDTIYASVLDSVNSFRINYTNLRSLPQLPDSGLQNIFCYNNKLITLPVLPADLKRLECYDNQLDTLTILSTGPGNVYVYADYNNLTSFPYIDSTVIGEINLRVDSNLISGQQSLLPYTFIDIKSLSCIRNQITGLDTLPDSLLSFNCAYNYLVSLPKLPRHGMELFDCSFNQINQLPTFQQVPYSQFNCSNNQLGGTLYLYSTIAQSFCSLNISHNQFTDIVVLQDTSNLVNLPISLSLDCSFNQLIDLPPVYSVSSYSYLNCDSNFISVFPDITIGSALSCRNNQLIDAANIVLLGQQFPGTNVYFDFSDNPALMCIPGVDEQAYSYRFTNTAVQCLSGSVNSIYSSPSVASTPLCTFNYNPDGCPLNYHVWGQVYYDSLPNCSLGNEPFFKNIKVKLYNNLGNVVRQSFSDDLGRYTLKFPVGGVYSIRADTSYIPFYPPCFNPTVTYSGTNLINPENKPLRCLPGFDLIAREAVQATGQLFPATQSKFKIFAGDLIKFYQWNTDVCNAGVDGTVQAVISGPAHYVSSTGLLAPTSVVSNVITWQLADISTANPFNAFGIMLETDTFATIGQEVCITVTISTSIIGDRDATNDQFTHCWQVLNSFDPNDKQVNPKQQVSPGDWLTYTVRFQNTGNAPAMNIFVLDTLSNMLDINSVQLIATSHNTTTDISADGVIRFDMPDINLVDEATNEDSSQGYIVYRVQVKDTALQGFVVHNTAHIFFDYNPPITTNTVTNINCSDVSDSTYNATVCYGNAYNFNNHLLYETGTYRDTVLTARGCDSIVELHLTKLPLNVNDWGIATACRNDGYYFGGNWLHESGTYYDTVYNPFCNYVNRVNLVVFEEDTTPLQISLCDGDHYVLNGQWIYNAGNYTGYYNNMWGCDSLILAEVDVKPVYDYSIDVDICDGEEYLFNGNYYFWPGTYTSWNTSIHGCDSIVTLNLQVHNNGYAFIEDYLCPGADYFFDGQFITSPGTYQAHLQTDFGCDSTVDLWLHTAFSDEENMSGIYCPGSPYLFDGEWLNDAGTYTHYYLNRFGCDSTVNINLGMGYISLQGAITHAQVGGMPGFVQPEIAASYPPLTFAWSNGVTTPYAYDLLAGPYSLTVTDSAGCTQVFNFTIPYQTGISDLTNTLNFNLLPNPAHNTVTLQLQNTTDAVLKLYDMVGALVQQQTIQQAVTQIDISQLPAGIYYVQVETEKGIGVKKLVVE